MKLKSCNGAPDLTVKIFFVEYGYQVDFYEDGVQVASEVRDYSEEYHISLLKIVAIKSIARTLKNIEQSNELVPNGPHRNESAGWLLNPLGNATG